VQADILFLVKAIPTVVIGKMNDLYMNRMFETEKVSYINIVNINSGSHDTIICRGNQPLSVCHFSYNL